MGFYGKVTNSSKTQFSFDKIYPNRKAMDDAAALDGVFVGRYVLVEYDKNVLDETTLQDKYTRIYADEINGKYYLSNIDAEGKWDETTLLRANQLSNGQLLYTMDTSESLGSHNKVYWVVNKTSETNFTLERFADTEFINNFKTDQASYGNFNRGYDSTVWTKVFDGEYKYVMVAELNSVVPTFDVTADAPTLSPVTPHFDADTTNVYYKLHTQPNWGFRVKKSTEEVSQEIDNFSGQPFNSNVAHEDYNFSSIETQSAEPRADYMPRSDEQIAWKKKEYNKNNPTGLDEYYYDRKAEGWINSEISHSDDAELFNADIYYNKTGFNPDIISYDSNAPEDYIKIEPSGRSGHSYKTHDGKKDFANDIQELSINLPSLGNAMSSIWDLVYGNKEINEGHDPVRKWVPLQLTRSEYKKLYNENGPLGAKVNSVEGDAKKQYQLYTVEGDFTSALNPLRDIDSDNGYQPTLYRYIEYDSRNLNINWVDALDYEKDPGLRLVYTTPEMLYSADKTTATYSPEKASTLAGAINSVHDLMGMIITAPEVVDENYINNSSDNLIYYVKNPTLNLFSERANAKLELPKLITETEFNSLRNDKEHSWYEEKENGTLGLATEYNKDKKYYKSWDLVDKSLNLEENSFYRKKTDYIYTEVPEAHNWTIEDLKNGNLQDYQPAGTLGGKLIEYDPNKVLKRYPKVKGDVKYYEYREPGESELVKPLAGVSYYGTDPNTGKTLKEDLKSKIATIDGVYEANEYWIKSNDVYALDRSKEAAHNKHYYKLSSGKTEDWYLPGMYYLKVKSQKYKNNKPVVDENNNPVIEEEFLPTGRLGSSDPLPYYDLNELAKDHTNANGEIVLDYIKDISILNTIFRNDTKKTSKNWIVCGYYRINPTAVDHVMTEDPSTGAIVESVRIRVNETSPVDLKAAPEVVYEIQNDPEGVRYKQLNINSQAQFRAEAKKDSPVNWYISEDGINFTKLVNHMEIYYAKDYERLISDVNQYIDNYNELNETKQYQLIFNQYTSLEDYQYITGISRLDINDDPEAEEQWIKLSANEVFNLTGCDINNNYITSDSSDIEMKQLGMYMSRIYNTLANLYHTKQYTSGASKEIPEIIYEPDRIYYYETWNNGINASDAKLSYYINGNKNDSLLVKRLKPISFFQTTDADIPEDYSKLVEKRELYSFDFDVVEDELVNYRVYFTGESDEKHNVQKYSPNKYFKRILDSTTDPVIDEETGEKIYSYYYELMTGSTYIVSDDEKEDEYYYFEPQVVTADLPYINDANHYFYLTYISPVENEPLPEVQYYFVSSVKKVETKVNDPANSELVKEVSKADGSLSIVQWADYSKVYVTIKEDPDDKGELHLYVPDLYYWYDSERKIYTLCTKDPNNVSMDWLDNNPLYAYRLDENNEFFPIEPTWNNMDEKYRELSENYYSEDKDYYIVNPNGDGFVPAKDYPYSPVQHYYQVEQFYVLDDDLNLYTQGSEWNIQTIPVPDSVHIARRSTVNTWEKLKGFSKDLFTINGLLLALAKKMEQNDIYTRDRNTVNGCINTLNDIISKFATSAPTNMVVIDSYGRYRGVDYITKQPDIITNYGIPFGEDHQVYTYTTSDKMDILNNVDDNKERHGRWLDLQVFNYFFHGKGYNNWNSAKESVNKLRKKLGIENFFKVRTESDESKVTTYTYYYNWIFDKSSKIDEETFRKYHSKNGKNYIYDTNYRPITSWGDLQDGVSYLWLLERSPQEDTIPVGDKGQEGITDEIINNETTKANLELWHLLIRADSEIKLVHNFINKDIAEKEGILLETKTYSDKNKGPEPIIKEAINAEYNNVGRNNHDKDTIELYTPIIDDTGHVVGHNIEDVVLPFEFKTINTENSDEAGAWNQTGDNGKADDGITPLTKSSGENTKAIVADSINDELTIDAGNKWIRFTTNNADGESVNSKSDKNDENKLTIAHETHSIDTTHKYTDLNKNADVTLTESTVSKVATDNITFQDLEFDTAGHVTKNQKHTYTLPFGFKFLTTNGISAKDNGDLFTTASSNIDEVEGADTKATNVGTKNQADNAQDTLAINPVNKWIQVKLNPNEATDAASTDTLEIAHEIHNINRSVKTTTDLNTTADSYSNSKDKLTFQDLEFDDAGHVIANQKHTYVLPYGVKTFYTTNSNSTSSISTTNDVKTSADNTQDELQLAAGNKWLEASTENDKITFAHEIHWDDSENGKTDHDDTFTGSGVHKFGSHDLNDEEVFKTESYNFDNAGHVVEHKTLTYELPHGYSYIKTKGDSTNNEFKAGNTGTTSAHKTKDSLELLSGNKWLNIVSNNTDGNDTITFYHSAAQEANKFKGDSKNQTPDYGSTFKVPYIGIDEAGHVHTLEEHTVTMPQQSIGGAGNVVTKADHDTGNTLTFTHEQLMNLKLSTSSTVETLAITKSADPDQHASHTSILSSNTLKEAIHAIPDMIDERVEDILGTATTDTLDTLTEISAWINKNGAELDNYVNLVTLEKDFYGLSGNKVLDYNSTTPLIERTATLETAKENLYTMLGDVDSYALNGHYSLDHNPNRDPNKVYYTFSNGQYVEILLTDAMYQPSRYYIKDVTLEERIKGMEAQVDHYVTDDLKVKVDAAWDLLQTVQQTTGNIPADPNTLTPEASVDGYMKYHVGRTAPTDTEGNPITNAMWIDTGNEQNILVKFPCYTYDSATGKNTLKWIAINTWQ